jgi:outer membrane protein TolC
MKHFIILLFILNLKAILAQDKIFTLRNFINMVKQNHPMAAMANLQIDQANAMVLAARGGFDPKIEGNLSEKNFANKEYYNQFNAQFKIPTWYGIEIKSAFENNRGIYLNPENLTTNPNGIYSLGIEIPLGQGLLINKRMADLRKAKTYQNLNQNLINQEVALLLATAISSYITWFETHKEKQMYQKYLDNVTIRKKGIEKLVVQGDKPAIDTTEISINLTQRKLQLENANLKFLKAQNMVNNFLWLNNEPIELQDNNVPETNLVEQLEQILELNKNVLNVINIQENPKILAKQNKIQILEIEKKLNADLLKPTLNFNYNILNNNVKWNQNFEQNNKFGLSFQMPLLLRKERGNLKLSKLKMEEANYQLQFDSQNLQNKIKYQLQEVSSFKKQLKLSKENQELNQTMLYAEEKLFNYGESSLFLVNTRENNLVSAELNLIKSNANYCNAIINLFESQVFLP